VNEALRRVLAVETLVRPLFAKGYVSLGQPLAERAWVAPGATIAITCAFTEIVEVRGVDVECDARFALRCGGWLAGFMGRGTVNVRDVIL
jgi:hypothetical protein